MEGDSPEDDEDADETRSPILLNPHSDQCSVDCSNQRDLIIFALLLLLVVPTSCQLPHNCFKGHSTKHFLQGENKSE